MKYQTTDAFCGYISVVRIELLKYTVKERSDLTQWLLDQDMPCDPGLGWNTGAIIYLDKADALMFDLRWS
jgi:hypothetical protein